MGHSHSFEREASSVYWDSDKKQMIVERDCQEDIVSSGPMLSGGMSGGPMMDSREACPATERKAYEIQSVVDYHDFHSGTHCVVVSENKKVTTEGAKHISEFDSDEIPAWVKDIKERAMSVVDGRDVELFMTHMGGPEIPITVATSDTEYNIVFSKVDEWVEE